MNDPHPANRVTLKDIAASLGLSRTAVSMALNNSQEIPTATRERVRAAAAAMGYQPNSLAASLARFRKSTQEAPIQAALAWLNFWPDPKQLRSFQEFDHYWQGAEACARKFGFRLEEFIWNEQTPSHRLAEILIARGVNGILLPPQAAQPQWSGFPWEHFAVVSFGRSLSMPGSHLVSADHVANAMTAVEEMQARGYNRIGFVGFNSFGNRHWLFDAGFLRAQLAMEKECRVPFLALDSSTPKKNRSKLLRWLEKEKPDALLTPCVEVREILENSGYKIPEDIALAAMSVLDGKAEAGIYQNSEEIGRVAVLVVISLLKDNDLGIPSLQREILIKGKWVDGGSLPGRK